MFIKLGMIILFFAVTLLVGVLSSRKAKGVDGFVLGGRSVGPWLTAFAYGTSYFSAVIFVGSIFVHPLSRLSQLYTLYPINISPKASRATARMALFVTPFSESSIF